ncbi:S8 family peptidase [Schaalia vaccimaxillae]|uniref:S8 family peptidase n=1 Tax=Schaalia vaccimaxillae TaxID=183916 RepID=UPI0003B4A086|nr:S8 family serine peptidase [Schaalia vaccimaxillae]
MNHVSRHLRVGSALAISCGLLAAGTVVAPAAYGADPIVSRNFLVNGTSDVENGVPRNYAVNLAEGSSQASLNAAVAAAQSLGAVPLAQYSSFSTFFVQAAQGDFASKLAAQLSGSVNLHSIGPTRGTVISGDEVVAPGVDPVAAAREADLEVGLAVTSQLDDFTPDPGSDLAWGLTAIGALEAQKVDVPLEAVTVAVLDTGIDATHEDLAAQVDASKSVGCQVNGLPNTAPSAWADDHYHGTHVAGTIAAAHNGIGVDGVAPSATLAAVKVSNADGMFYPEYVVCGFDWVTTHGIDITNNSYYVDPWEYWVPTESSQAAGYEAVRRAVQYSTDNGVVNFGAEGNSDADHDNPTIDDGSPNDTNTHITGRDVTNGIDMPSMLPGILSVSAVALPANADPATAVLERSDFSNYGVNSVDIAAPGSAIYSTIPNGYRVQYANLSGTSMASPHAAGVAALLKAIHPDVTPSELANLMKKQAGELYSRLADPAQDAGKEYRGAGLVNALAAVLKDQPKPTVTAVEYSTDGQNWQPLEGAELTGQGYIRVTVAGPVTAATVSIPGLANFGGLEGTADGSFGGMLVLTSDQLTFEAVDPTGFTVEIAAYGRNNDERADDDVTASTAFTVKPAQPAVTPAVSDAQADTVNSNLTGESKAVAKKKGASSQLASTGVQSGVVGLATALLLAGITLCSVAGLAVKAHRNH